MEIIVAKNSGFCFGVKKAVDCAKHLAGESTYTLGEIIHNEGVCADLQKRGVKILRDPSLAKAGDTVIIRSHGVDLKTEALLKSTGAKIVDMTCPFVAKIHEIVSRFSKDGYTIAILGSAAHPEVVGIRGRCSDGDAIIFDGKESDDEVFKAIGGKQKVCLVEQTTFSVKIYEEFLKKVAKCDIKTLEIFNTICYTTYCRQEEAERLARDCDAVLVIGSKTSSNTMKLYSVCKAINERTYSVQSVDDVKSINFSTKDVVGITAGASVPSELIMEVKEYMSDKNMTDVVDFAEEVEKSFVNYKPGKRIKGTVISTQENGIVLSIGGKNDAFISKDDVNLDGSYNPDDYKAGDELEVKIVGKDQETGLVVVSKKAVDEIKEADKFVDTIRNGETFEVKIDKEVKGGLITKLGTYTIFIPASHIKSGRFPKDTKQYVGKKLVVSAIEIDDAKHRIIASAKNVEEAEKAAKAEIFWANVVPNVVVTGVVKRFSKFGAFVSVDGFDCLAHIVDLSWFRINSPDEVLEIGKTYEFLVLSANKETGRVSLGYKQLQAHPFVACMEKHPVGSTCKGKVVSVVAFGAFVEVEPRIEGLVHVSEISRTFVKDINEVIKVGDEVEVQVISYDEANRKINLSIKACLPEEVVEVAEVAETEEAPKKVRKTKAKKVEEPEEEKEWSEETSNNPFAALLKDFDAEDDEK